MPREKCVICSKFLSNTEGIRCGNYELPHHKVCAGLLAKTKIPLNWHCSKCRRGKNKGKDEDSSSNSNSTPASTNSVTTDSEELTIKDVIREIQALRLDLLNFRKELIEMKTEIQSCKELIEGQDVRTEALENCLLTECRPHHADINNFIDHLKADLNDRDQELLANDLEIRNIPEQKNENLTHLVVILADQLEISLENRDIVSVERIGSPYVISTNADEDAIKTRPRPMVVRLVRRDLRDDLLSKARVHRNVTTSSLGFLENPEKIYINERLTRMNRGLFRLAREAGRTNGWKYVWTKRGRVLARRKTGETVVKIRNEQDIIEKLVPYI